jgi:hypothetical protein
MKKLFILMLVLTTMLTFVACGNGSSSKTTEGTQKTEVSESENTNEVSPQEEAKPLEIKESGYVTSEGFGDYYVHYAITIFNPNESTAIEYPSFRITAKDKDGLVTGTDDMTLHMIYPGQELTFASQGPSSPEKPSSVEFEIIPPDEYYIIPVSDLEYSTPAVFAIEGVKKSKDTVTGTVKSNNDYLIDDVQLVIAFKNKDGKLIGGTTTYVDKLAANGSAPFEFDTYISEYVTDDYEIFAYSRD